MPWPLGQHAATFDFKQHNQKTCLEANLMRAHERHNTSNVSEVYCQAHLNIHDRLVAAIDERKLCIRAAAVERLLGDHVPHCRAIFISHCVPAASTWDHS